MALPAPSAMGHPVERRANARQRTLLAGRLAYGDPAVSVACGIRNLSQGGALVELEGPALLMSPVRLLLAREGVVYDVTVAWRRDLRVGLTLGDRHDLREAIDPQIRVLQQIWKEMALR